MNTIWTWIKSLAISLFVMTGGFLILCAVYYLTQSLSPIMTCFLATWVCLAVAIRYAYFYKTK